MVGANIIRSLPMRVPTDAPFDTTEDDEQFSDPAWSHLEPVYELLLRFVVSPDPDPIATRTALSVDFVAALVDLFNSEDAYERAALKTILHRVYGKLMGLRVPIRQAILNVFHRVAYGAERYNGLPELLEILGSIINGFAVPLKEEHKTLLRNGLVPLHLPDALPAYHVQLAYSVVQFVEKDTSLGAEVMLSLLKHWPVYNSRKEVMLLSEMEEVLELVASTDLQRIVRPLFRRIGRCIESSHFQVAERALFFWNNEYVVDEILVRHRDVLMPAVIGPLLRNRASHWNPNVLSLSCHVLGHLRSMDSKLFDKCLARYEADVQDEVRREEERMIRWREVYRLAQLRSRSKPQTTTSSQMNGTRNSSEKEAGEQTKGRPNGLVAVGGCVSEMVKDSTNMRLRGQA